MTRGRMDFTGREFWGGALASWVIFMALLTAALLAFITFSTVAMLTLDGFADLPMTMLVFFGYGLPIGAFVAALTTLIGAPFAWMLGRVLVRCESVRVHVLSYACLGIVVGVVFTLFSSRDATGGITLDTPYAPLVIGACVVSVTGGRAWSLWRSRARRTAAGHSAAAERSEAAERSAVR